MQAHEQDSIKQWWQTACDAWINRLLYHQERELIFKPSNGVLL